jgi:zinc transport system substrate-binding protein
MSLKKLAKSAALLLAIISVISVTACAAKKTVKFEGGKLKVLVTFNAMKEFAQAVGKDKVEIATVIPDGTEPHDFELKPKDMVAMSCADVFVYNGMEMEPWVDDAVRAASNDNMVTVNASKGIEPIKSAKYGRIVQEDPHVWLSIKCAETEVKNIKDGLIKADSKNRDYYQKNCDSYISQLEIVYNDYAAKFKTAKSRDFVTGHAAFAYMCRDFNLEQSSVEDVFAEGEPSAQSLNQLISYCKSKGVKTVFVEDMVSPEVSKTLADSVGADVKTIYTMESSEDNKTYLQRIESNLSEIYESLR